MGGEPGRGRAPGARAAPRYRPAAAAGDSHRALRSACSVLRAVPHQRQRRSAPVREGDPAPPASRGHHAAASAGRARPGAAAVELRGARREVKSGRTERIRSRKNYSTRRAAGRWRRAVPAQRLRKSALRRPGKARSDVGRPPFASLGSQGARGRSGLFPLHFASRRAGRGFEINPARAWSCKAARPAESEPGAGEKGDPAPRAENMPAGGGRRRQGRPPSVRRAQRLPPPQPQGSRLLCQRCRHRPQEEPGTPQKDHVSGNRLRSGAGCSPAPSAFQPRGRCVSPQPRFSRGPRSRWRTRLGRKKM